MFKKYFVTGLVILLPLAVTIAIIGWVINLLTRPFVSLLSEFFVHLNIFSNGFLFLTQEQIIRCVSQLLILTLLLFFTLALGMITRWFFFTSLIKFSDRILHRIPIVNTVYKTTQDIIRTLFVSNKKTFQQVVMVAFPHPGVFVLGLVAREAPAACSKKLEHELISVFIPTTPNPTSGFLLLYKKEDLIYVDMPTEDALKFIISCGVIVPQDRNADQNANPDAQPQPD